MLYNELLDEADRHRLDMGDITENVSLKSALECSWGEQAGRTGMHTTGDRTLTMGTW